MGAKGGKHAGVGGGGDGNNDKKISGSGAQECPICFEDCMDVEVLPHAGSNKLTRSMSGRDVSEHKACGTCRASMLKANQKCPWCRDEVVWKQVLDFLDGLKKNVGKANNPDSLADLMAQWQMYEVTRSNSDVVLFAQDMCQDLALSSHLDRAIRSNPGFLRDSSGLWMRFHAMLKEGEMKLSDLAVARRLEKAVEVGLKCYESNGGGAPQHGGAMYCQVCVALLCASQSNMKTSVLVEYVKRVGHVTVKFHKGKKAQVREKLPRDYAAGVSALAWGGEKNDPVFNCFFK